MRILVLGASGMIGSAIFDLLSHRDGWELFGVCRSSCIEKRTKRALLHGYDLTINGYLQEVFSLAAPNVVINCAGATKHRTEGNLQEPALKVNALLPHQLLRLCKIANARLIHISTDCVFSGKIGNYSEGDAKDATDVYGMTKALGEIDSEDAVTLRTSTIGHENGTRLGLLEWFLAQSQCSGYKKALFSGLTSVEFARVIRDHVIPNEGLCGVYNVGGDFIDKFSLLQKISHIYGTAAKIEVNETFRIDRTLNSSKFRTDTGYMPPDWDEMLAAMYRHQEVAGCKNV